MIAAPHSMTRFPAPSRSLSPPPSRRSLKSLTGTMCILLILLMTLVVKASPETSGPGSRHESVSADVMGSHSSQERLMPPSPFMPAFSPLGMMPAAFVPPIMLPNFSRRPMFLGPGAPGPGFGGPGIMRPGAGMDPSFMMMPPQQPQMPFEGGRCRISCDRALGPCMRQCCTTQPVLMPRGPDHTGPTSPGDMQRRPAEERSA